MDFENVSKQRNILSIKEFCSHSF